MFRFNKDVEYALIALAALSQAENGNLLSAREISERYVVPYKLLSRILQKLSAGGVLTALQGPKGGYKLDGTTEDIRLGQIIRAVRGVETIADCLGECGCEQDEHGCIIKPAIQGFQEKWIAYVEDMRLAEFLQETSCPAVAVK